MTAAEKDASSFALSPAWRLAIAVLVPFAAAALQWALWPWLQPYAYVLMFPAVFVSAHLAGRRGGLIATVVCAGLAVYLFVPPQLSFAVASANGLWSVAVFAACGYVIADVQGRLERARDVATAAVGESEDRYRGLFGSMLEGMAYCEMFFDAAGEPVDRRYLDVNPAFTRITGIEGAKGTLVSELLPGIKDTNPELFEIYGRVAETGEPADFGVYVPVLPQGQWLRISVTRPAPNQFIALFTDITERKAVEEDIRELNATLERRVEQRSAEVMAANKELESFAYAVSHDLRAPLRAMSGFSKALEEDYPDVLDDRGKQYIEHIVGGSRKMADLIDGLLALSRATRGEMARQTVDVSELATCLLGELERSQPHRRVAWTVEPGLRASGDSRMIEALMRNLLGNAWKYTGKTDEPRVEIGSEESDGKRWVCVKDNGAGYDPAFSDQLFKPFQRLHRQDEFSGIGIGLATVLRIVDRHGGQIRSSSALDRGATFCFWLPDEPDAE